MIRSKILLLNLAAALSANLTLNAQVTSGLQLWLKPEGLTNTVNLSKVSYWTNSLGSGNDATNGIAANQPMLLQNGLSGHPVVRFLDSGSDAVSNPNLNWLVSPLPFSANSNSFTAIVVAESQLRGARDTLLQQLGAGTTLLYFQTNATAPTPIINSFASGRELRSPYAYQSGAWKIYALVQDAVAGIVKLYENGSLLGTTNIGTTASLANTGWLLGCSKNKNTHGLNGDIAEVMVYDTALSSGDVGTTTYYLAQKFGFVVLTDNFDTADTANLDDNIATRQSGFVAPMGYNWTLAAIANNQVTLSVPTGPFQAQSFSPDTNLVGVTGRDFKVSYDITSFTNSGGLNDTWAGVVLNATNIANPIVWPYGLSAIIFTNGGYGVWVDAVGAGGGNPSPAMSPPFHVEITVSANVATLNIQGTNTDGISTNSIIQCVLNCPVGNYVSLSIGGQAAATVTYDNLSITASPQAAEIAPVLPPPTLLLADTYTTADTTNLDADLTTRQTGSAATVPYTTVGIFNAQASIQGNQLVLSNTPTGTDAAVGMVAPNLDFRLLEHLSSFRLRCTFNPVGSGNEWAGIRFREDWPGVFVANGTTPGVGFIVRGNGVWAMFLGGNVISQGAATLAPGYTLEVNVRENVLRATLNGEDMKFGCSDLAYALPPTQTRNYITLESFASPGVPGFYATFDDLQVYSLNSGSTVTQPTLLNPVFLAGATNAFRFDFNAAANVFYVVDRKSDLAAPGWSDVQRLYGGGGSQAITNSPAASGNGFYRLRIP